MGSWASLRDRSSTTGKPYNTSNPRSSSLTGSSPWEVPEEHQGSVTRTRVTQKTVAERTWYTPEAWEHGGLRIKNEVKDEAGMDTDQPASKRVKKETAK